jgi:hypothetical protein
MTRIALIDYPTPEEPLSPVQTALLETRLFNLTEYFATNGWEAIREYHGELLHRVVVIQVRDLISDRYLSVGHENRMSRPPALLDWRDIAGYDPAAEGSAEVLAALQARPLGADAEQLATLLIPDEGAAAEVAVDAPTSEVPFVIGDVPQLAEPFHLLARGDEIAQLTVQGGTVRESRVRHRELPTTSGLALSNVGDIAVALDGTDLLLWRDGTATPDRDAAFIAATGLDPATLRLIAVRTIDPRTIEVIAADRSRLVAIIRSSRGTWREPEPLEEAEVVAGALLGRKILAIDPTGAGWWVRGHDSALPSPDDFVGADILVLPGHDVVATWGTDSRGSAAGWVFARRYEGNGAWTLLREFPGAIRLGLSRPIAAGLVTPASRPDAAVVYAQGPDGTVTGPVPLEFGAAT